MAIVCSKSCGTATLSRSISISTSLEPGLDVALTPVESAGSYLFNSQSMVNPAALLMRIQELYLTSGQYQLKPWLTPVTFHSLIL